jgi:hypothetical protein
VRGEGSLDVGEEWLSINCLRAFRMKSGFFCLVCFLNPTIKPYLGTWMAGPCIQGSGCRPSGGAGAGVRRRELALTAPLPPSLRLGSSACLTLAHIHLFAGLPSLACPPTAFRSLLTMAAYGDKKYWEERFIKYVSPRARLSAACGLAGLLPRTAARLPVAHCLRSPSTC